MSSYRHPFKEYVPSKKYKVDKVKLRADIKAATQKYLSEGNKIEKIKDGPTAKVPSLGVLPLKVYVFPPDGLGLKPLNGPRVSTGNWGVGGVDLLGIGINPLQISTYKGPNTLLSSGIPRCRYLQLLQRP